MKLSLSGFAAAPKALAAVVTVFALAALSSAAWAQTAPAPAAPTTAPARPLNTLDQFQGRIIEEVKIVGNATVPAAVIRNLLGTRQGDKFDPATVEEDYHRIYELKKFANVVPEVEPTATGVIVIYQVAEPRAITAIRFRGNANVDTPTLIDKIEMKAGQSIDPFRINLARQAIERYYREENYPFTHVEIVQEQLQSAGVLVFSIVEGPRVRVRKIDFPGNHSFEDSKLKDQIKSRSYIFIFQAGILDTDQVDDDAAALRKFYNDHGFFDARVGRKLTFSADQSEVMISFVIDEGARYVISSLRFEGNHEPHNDAMLRQHIKIVEGKTYDYEAIQHDMREIVRAYGPGYIFDPGSDNPAYLVIKPVQIFHRDAGKVDLIYHISEGSKFHVADVIVKGDAKIDSKVFRRELRVSPGDWYDSATLADAVDRIKALRVADSVTITPTGDDPEYRTVLVDVSETQTALFMIGAGFSSNTGVLGQISYEQRNFDITNVPSSFDELFSSRSFTGSGQYFRVVLQPGTQVSTARVQWEEPWVFDQPYSFGSDIYYQTWIRENYDEIHEGGKFTLGRRFGNTLTAQISLRAEDVDIDHVLNEAYRPLEILDAEGHHSVTSMGLGLRYNTTDNPILPTHGFVAGAAYERVGAIGGEYDFNKFSADGSTYQLINEDLLGRKTTLAEHIQAAYEDPDGPFFERFYGGGIGDVLGFRYRGIGPRAGIEHDPIGGDFSLVSSAELNFPLVSDALRGVTFVDAGTVEKDLEITTIRTSIGVGFRLALPFFGQVPLALNFAVPITRGRYDNTQLVSFSLGFAQ